jgi:N6-L-threonylcarbamoyladenine synthase
MYPNQAVKPVEQLVILAIETSCDDTAIAIYRNAQVLAHTRMSQEEMCNKYGGVVPDVAARNHFFNLNTCLQQSLHQAGMSMQDIDCIACTIGPGLIGSLIVASSFAKYLCKLTGKMFIPIHHIEAHLDVLNATPPYLAVIISGGHSQILLCRSEFEYEEVCVTLDDAFGEIIDKLGRALGLPVPSGVHIEQLAHSNTCTIDSSAIVIAMPGKLAFSNSGLKTHFLRLINDSASLDVHRKSYIAALLQATIAANLHVKIQMAMQHTQCFKVIVAGGVAANKYIRNELSYCNFAPIELCTDNGIMVAMSAYKHIRNNSAHINNYNIAEFASMSLRDWCCRINNI